MKFLRYFLIFLITATVFNSCKKDVENLWQKDIGTTAAKVTLTDISGEYFDPKVATPAFKQKYPWFQGTVSDKDFELRRKDTAEIKLYREAVSTTDQNKLKNDLAGLFARIKHYFPEFRSPKVYLFSSALQMAKDPVFFQPQENMLFIDVTGFMGENNPNYKGLEQYFQKSMNPHNIVPKVSQILAEQMVPADGENQKFIDKMIYNGKIMTLQDAFLPNVPEHLKLNYTPEQFRWAAANESNIWNFFVENNLVFSDDQKLEERFIAPAPFSKFYTAIDNESSPQAGIFTGWQICRRFYEKYPDTKLQDFLKMSGQEIFNKSEYKPK